MRRSFPRPVSTLVQFFAWMIQVGSRWQSSQYLVDSSVRSSAGDAWPRRNHSTVRRGNATKVSVFCRASTLSAMSLLTKIGGPRDLRTLSRRQLTSLASDLTWLMFGVFGVGGGVG